MLKFILFFLAFAGASIAAPTNVVEPIPVQMPVRDPNQPREYSTRRLPCTTKLSEQQIQSGIDGEQYRWRNGFFLQIATDFTAEERTNITEGLTILSQHVCIPVGLWPDNASPTGDWVRIQRGAPNSGCYADAIGRRGGRQLINLEPNGCTSVDTAIHEAIHAIGYYHEQARPDRDQYIDIFWNNIIPGDESQFDIQSDSLTYGVPYDVLSIMQYDSYSFSSNQRPTMLAKDGSEIPWNTELTANDISKLKRMYNCPE